MVFRLSADYYRRRRAAEDLMRARQNYEQAQAFNKRWRRKNPNRDPGDLFALWNNNKTARSKEFAALMVQFMSTFDGVSEANAMMRHGLDAADAQIDLNALHDMAGKVFILRMFELFSANVALTPYTRELILQRLVPQLFAPAARSRAAFDAAVVPLAEDPVNETRTRRR